MKMYLCDKHKFLSMSKKTVTETLTKPIELINIKVKEINDRRRGMKITRIEDELDRQELDNYARFLGVKQGTVSLESAQTEVVPRNNIFYATLIIEGLIELSLVYFTFSILSATTLDNTAYIMAAVLMAMFAYIAYTMTKALRSK
jgi:hypothetical protein